MQATAILKALEIEPLLQISNINIPRILSEMLDLDLDDFRHVNIEKFLSLENRLADTVGLSWRSLSKLNLF